MLGMRLGYGGSGLGLFLLLLTVSLGLFEGTSILFMRVMQETGVHTTEYTTETGVFGSTCLRLLLPSPSLHLNLQHHRVNPENI
jgi:hypothetical protein